MSRSAAALRHAVRAARAYPGLNVPLTNALRLGLRGLGRESPWLTKHLPRSGVSTVALPNGARLRLWSRGDDWISTQIFWRGLRGYEPETVPIFLGLAAQAPVIVDVGAYVGYFTVMAALANPGARVIALEPFPATFDRLRRNVRLNAVANVVERNVAAGAAPGAAELHHMARGMSMAASLAPAHLAPWEHVTTTVPVVRLDQLLGDLGVARVDLLKVDAEATEVDVLEGAHEILRRDHPHIVCEVLSADSGKRLTDLLKPLGYRFFELQLDGLRWRDTIGPEAAGNYLFTTSPPADLPGFVWLEP